MPIPITYPLSPDYSTRQHTEKFHEKDKEVEALKAHKLAQVRRKQPGGVELLSVPSCKQEELQRREQMSSMTVTSCLSHVSTCCTPSGIGGPQPTRRLPCV